jgi:ABC-2 type transport system permease protein
VSTRAFGSELPKVAAFMRRDLLITLSYPAGFASDVVQLGGQVLMFGLIGRLVEPTSLPEYGGSPTTYLQFVAIGALVSLVFGLLLDRVSAALRTEQLIGTLEALLVAPVRMSTLQTGSVAFDAVQIPLRMGLFLAVIAIVAGLDLHVSGVLPSVTVLAATMPFVWGLGLVSAGAILTFRRGGGVTGLAAMLLGLSSGAFFPLSVLPPGLESVLSWNPLAICLDSIRSALIGGEGWGAIGPDLLVLVPLSVASLAAGAAAFRAAVARELRRGTLGRY